MLRLWRPRSHLGVNQLRDQPLHRLLRRPPESRRSHHQGPIPDLGRLRARDPQSDGRARQHGLQSDLRGQRDGDHRQTSHGEFSAAGTRKLDSGKVHRSRFRSNRRFERRRKNAKW